MGISTNTVKSKVTSTFIFSSTTTTTSSVTTKSNIPIVTAGNGFKSISISNSTNLTALSNSTGVPVPQATSMLNGNDPNLGAVTNPESAMFIFYIVLAVILILLAGCCVENIYSRSENRHRKNKNQKNQITIRRSESDELEDIERGSKSASKMPTQRRNPDTQGVQVQIYGTKNSRKDNDSGTFKNYNGAKKPTN